MRFKFMERKETVYPENCTENELIVIELATNKHTKRKKSFQKLLDYLQGKEVVGITKL